MTERRTFISGPSSSGGGGGGGAVTIADGADVTAGAIADAKVVADLPGTINAKLRGLVSILADVWDAVAHRLNVTVGNFPATQPVSGTVAVSNLPATQPVSGTVGVNNFPATQPVSGTVGVNNFPATQPVSGTVTVDPLTKATYRATVTAGSPLSSNTIPTYALVGSATKLVRVLRVCISISAATGAISDISLQKFSSITGSPSAVTIAKNDSADANATAVFNTYVIIPTAATAIGGKSASQRYEIVTVAVSVQPGLIVFTFGEIPDGKGLVLRGVTEILGICFNGVGTTPVDDVWIEWTEE